MDSRIIKYYQHELTEQQELELLQEAHKNKELKRQMMDYQNVIGLSNLSNQMKDELLGKRKYNEFKHRIQQKQTRYFTMQFMKIAAIVILVFGVTWILSQNYYNDIYNNNINKVAIQKLNVPAGQRAQITLSDGTKVWLNANSHLFFPTGFGKERLVFLVGEGYFEVAKDKEKPFIVSTQGLNIKALGTKFNISAYPQEDIQKIYLAQGSVRVYIPKHEQNGVTLKPHQMLTKEGTETSLENINSTDFLLWKDGIYCFNKLPMSKIIKSLELYFDVHIVIKDPQILNYVYTGKFRQRDGAMEILRIIQNIHHFKIKKEEVEKNEIILY